MGHKVKTLVDILDTEANKVIKKGTVHDFGTPAKNKKTVDNKWAEWHVEKEVKEIEKKEETPNKTTSSGKGKKETK